MNLYNIISKVSLFISSICAFMLGKAVYEVIAGKISVEVFLKIMPGVVLILVVTLVVGTFISKSGIRFLNKSKNTIQKEYEKQKRIRHP